MMNFERELSGLILEYWEKRESLPKFNPDEIELLEVDFPEIEVEPLEIDFPEIEVEPLEIDFPELESLSLWEGSLSTYN